MKCLYVHAPKWTEQKKNLTQAVHWKHKYSFQTQEVTQKPPIECEMAKKSQQLYQGWSVLNFLVSN